MKDTLHPSITPSTSAVGYSYFRNRECTLI